MAASPFFHGVPRLDDVVPKHPSPGPRDRWAGRNPAVGAYCNQVGLDCGQHGLEVNEPLCLARTVSSSTADSSGNLSLIITMNR